jgi:hypothetical protein
LPRLIADADDPPDPRGRDVAVSLILRAWHRDGSTPAGTSSAPREGLRLVAMKSPAEILEWLRAQPLRRRAELERLRRAARRSCPGR